ncbi:MAG: major facilitator transporter [Chlorobi bacterium OLB5]|nr:MAG: major facilitator transporter [Chlorobi bacterium OLB5]
MITNNPTPAKQDPFLALRFAEFRYYLFSNFFVTVGLLIQEVIIGYELYRLTRDPLAIGMIGLAEAIPFILLSLFGGHYSDKLKKKNILIWSLSFIMLASVVLYFLSFSLLNEEHAGELKYVIWSVIFFIGVCKAFFFPASTSIKTYLVPREVYANSATWSSSSWQTGVIIGPGVSGFLYSLFGFSGTLLFVIGILFLSIIAVTLIKNRPPDPSEEGTMLQKIKEGFSYTYKTKIIFYSISLDMFSVMFGGVVAILPVFAEDILGVGAEGLGIMRAAPSVGAVLVLLILSKYPPMKRAWRNLLWAVAGFGIATLVFALSENFILSVAALFATGAFDSVSVVIRSTLLQLLVPDYMRGRVNAINGIFLSSSNEVGAFESGLAAKLMGTVPSVVFGGVMTMVIVTYIWLKSRDLLKKDFSS